MTKSKKSTKVLVLFGVMIIACLSAMGLALNKTSKTAFAASTTPVYTAYFDYDHNRGTYIGRTNTDVGEGTNVTTSEKLQVSEGNYDYLTMQIYGMSTSGTGTLAKGGYIGSKAVTVKANVGYQQHTIEIRNSSGIVARADANTCTAYSLADGYYSVTYTGASEWVVDGNIRDHPQATQIIATTGFTVDYTAPIISGASTSSTGFYTNKAFTVSATDSGSGVSKLYWQDPSSSSYSVISASSKTIAAGSLNGLYRFYAVDNVDNISATYYVYYDNVAPVGNIQSENGVLSSGAYTNKTFSYSATDSGSGISKLEYKTPSSSSWATYTSGTLIPTTSTNGKYSFRAYDKSGNVSTEKYVYLDTSAPVGTLYGGTSTVANNGKTKADYVKFVASDTLSGVSAIYVKRPNSSSYVSYTSGSQETVDGKYQFYCLDKCSNTSATYTITLDKTAPVLSCSIGSFYETTSNSFTVSASDLGSVNLYYKTPSMSSYALASGSSYNVSNMQEDGKYYFYASDDLGNTASTVWVELSVSVPTFNIIRSDSDNSVYITWTESGYTVTVNGNAYTKGTWIKSEGSYTVMATNSYGRVTTKTFSISHYYEAQETVSPNCTENGYTIYKCVHCGNTYNDDIVNAVGHSYNNTVASSSCTESGYTTHKCTVCGYTYKSNQTEALGHSYKSVVTSPNCTESGYTTYTCSRCSHTYTANVTQATGHSYRSEITSPTCEQGGHTKFVCRNCDFSYISNYVSALGHNYVETTVAAGCGTEGYTLHDCTRCDYEYKTDYVAAVGHTYIEEAVSATCTESGGINHTCTVCGFTYQSDVVPATGHSYTSEILSVATCVSKGERRHSCELCGDTYTTVIPATGHSYQIDSENNRDGVITRHYICSQCGDSYTEELGEQYEMVSNYVVYLFEQYSPYMIWVFLATAGIWSIAMGVAMIIAHKNEDKEKAKRMLVNYLIGMVAIFCILVACPYLVKGIAVLVT